jgi:hypothetical protein
MGKAGITIRISFIIRACGKMIINKERVFIATRMEFITETGSIIGVRVMAPSN